MQNKLGQQVGFYMVGEDESYFLQFAEQIGLKAIPAVINTGESVGPLAPTEFLMSAEQDAFFLLPETLTTENVLYQKVTPNPSRSILMTDASPAIEFMPSPREGELLFNGRIYFGMDKDYINYREAKKRYDQLARQVRKWPRTDKFNFHVGPRAAELARQGQLHLMHFKRELRLA